MTDTFIIGIDLGTTGCRASVYSADGIMIANHYIELEILHPEPGAAEQNADDWWLAVNTCIKEITSQRPDIASVVSGICCSTQGHSWVMTDENFIPLRPALTWLDSRAADYANELCQTHGNDFWGKIAGKMPGPWHLLPQLLWLHNREPELVEQAAYYLFAQDYLNVKLTGNVYTDETMAAGSLIYDIVNRQWSSQVAEINNVNLEIFASVLPAGSIAGKLLPEVAESLGLPAEILVVVGAQDQKCAALAAGLQPGCATLSLGTSSAITALSQNPVFVAEAGIPCFPYFTNGTWVLEAPLSTTGAALRWLRDFIRGFGIPELDYASLTRLAEASPCGSNGVFFMPFLAGAGAPHWVATATGSLHGITLQTTPGDVVRAVLEGVAYEIQTNLEVMKSQDIRVNTLRVFGGGARSDLWAQIIADVTNCKIERMNDVEMAGKGVAILAHHAILEASSIFETANLWPCMVDTFTPDNNQTYSDLFRRYVQIRNACM